MTSYIPRPYPKGNNRGRNATEISALPDAAVITRTECARFLGTTAGTLSKWASDGKRGPSYITLGHGGWVRYRMGDVRAFLDKNYVSVDGAA